MSAIWLFVSGLTTMGFVIAGLFFLRFWRRTRDNLFIYFGLSFFLLALGQGLAGLYGSSHEDQSWIYLIRLAAFLLLIAGIIGKNLRRSSRRYPTLKPPLGH